MSPRSHVLNEQILEEAAEWFVELEDEDAGFTRRQAFDEWLRRSPEHVRAFLELVPLWESGTTRSAPLEAATLIARMRGGPSNVIPFAGETRKLLLPAKRSVRWRALAVAAAVVAVAATGTLGWWFVRAAPTYATEVAEQRSIVLTDGSSVELNTRSRIRVRFTDRERVVQLLEGQALFRVKKDPSRPFVVSSGDVRVRAVGTEFDVYRHKDRTIVTVIEGRVAVLPVNSDVTPIDVLSAGQSNVSARGSIGAPRLADVNAATAWVQRRLMFQKTSLGEVVEEFNRYNMRELRIEDAGLAAFLVSGTFASTDPQSLLNFLRAQPGIRVVETEDVVRIESIGAASDP